MSKKRILVTGGAGLLGSELKKHDKDIMAPARSEMDITDKNQVVAAIEKYKPDILLHAAAKTNNRLVEKEPQETISTNIIGTANIAVACLSHQLRLVYISTDYVYKGDRGNYNEEDELLPFNLYSWSKLGGECAVRGCRDYLIIRTSFGHNIFEHPAAFTDKWSSKDTVSVIAPMILKAAVSPMQGVINIGTEPKTVYDYAIKSVGARGIKAIKMSDAPHPTPADTTLDVSRWKKFIGEEKRK